MARSKRRGGARVITPQIIRTRRRTLALQITNDAQLVVRAPTWASESIIRNMINDKAEWILKRLEVARQQKERMEQRRADPNEPPESWHRERAREIIPERVRHYAALSGLHYTSLRISGARTRWGSCSTKGTLSFSWRLAKAPLWVVDYVVAHELAHLVEHNHSKNFWARVASIYPAYKEARRWLRVNQDLLV